MKKNNKGFTLVEILAVIVILGIVMIIALPTYSSIYNSIKLTTYINTIKSVKTAALDYAGNSYIKDNVKDAHDKASSSSASWCKTVSIDNLIRGGYLKSDFDDKNAITDVFTGLEIGHDIYDEDGRTTGSINRTVSLCYCKDNLDITAYVTKDLDYGEIYHKGEVVRVLKNGKFEYRELTASFIYDELTLSATKAKNGSKRFSVDGITVQIGSVFDGVAIEDEVAFRDAINKLIVDYLTLEPTCKR